MGRLGRAQPNRSWRRGSYFVAPPLTETATAAFTTAPDPALFSTAPNATTTGGQLVVPVQSGYGGTRTQSYGYSLLGSAVLVEVAQAPNVGNGGTEAYLQVYSQWTPLARNGVQFYLNNGNLQAQHILNGTVTTAATAAYNATAHRWWRIREAAGTVSWETSPDGFTWTVFASAATATLANGGIQFRAVRFEIGTGYFGTETSPGTTIFDNLNVPPAPGTVLDIGPARANHFELQMARAADAGYTTVTQDEIAAGFAESPYFTTVGNAVQFNARLDAPVVGSSTSSRAELRETNPDGSGIGFDATTGTHVLHGRTTITHLPPVKPEVIIAQLHNGSVDRVHIRTQLVTGSIRLRCRINGSSVAPDFAAPYVLGTEFEWKIEIVDNEVRVYYNDMVTPAVVSPAALVSTGGPTWYFKVGMYNQSNVASGDAADEYGQTSLRDLSVAHATGATALAGTDSAALTESAAVVPLTAAVLTESGDLTAVVADVYANRTNTTGAETYVVPDAAAHTAFHDAFAAIVAGNYPGAATLVDGYGYDVVQFHDTVTGRDHILLRERTGARFWGFYVWALAPDSRLVVEAPHPRADINTHTEAAALFNKDNSRALLIATSHRNSNAALDADGDNISDVANADGPNTFQAVHEAAAAADAWVVQIHGFADASDTLSDIVLSEGQPAPTQRTQDLATALRNSAGAFRVRVWGPDNGVLSATPNVQGQHSRASGIYWLSIEQNTTLRNSATSRGIVEDAIAAWAVSAAGPTAVADTDTGTLAEAGAADAGLADTDPATLAEAGTAAATLADLDTATLAEAGTPGAAPTDVDAAALAEAGAADAALADLDAGTLAEASAVDTTAAGVDAGTLGEAATADTDLPGVDAAALTETGVADTTAADVDTAALAELAAPDATLGDLDAATLGEAGLADAVAADLDAATLGEAAGVSSSDLLADLDTAALTEAGTAAATLADADTATLGEAAALVVLAADTDAATGVDTGAPDTALVDLDGAALGEAGAGSADLADLDAAGLGELGGADATLDTTEAATLGEAAAPDVAVLDTDQPLLTDLAAVDVGHAGSDSAAQGDTAAADVAVAGPDSATLTEGAADLALADLDTATLTEQATADAALDDADTAAGTDLADLAFGQTPVADLDTATLTDTAAPPAVTLADADAATAAEQAAPAATLADADGVAMVDAGAVDTVAAGTDDAALTDTGALAIGTESYADLDTATLGEAASVVVFAADTDTAGLDEQTTAAAVLAGFDTAGLDEQPTVGIATEFYAASDAAVLAELAALFVDLDDVDTAELTEGAELAAALVGADTGHGVDTGARFNTSIAATLPLRAGRPFREDRVAATPPTRREPTRAAEPTRPPGPTAGEPYRDSPFN